MAASQPEVVIVGAGPAGIAAAIQLRRSEIPFVLLEKDRVGGLLWNANLVENYPGFPNGISGPRLIALFEKQMRRLGIEVVADEVTSLDVGSQGPIVGARAHTYSPRAVLVASGTAPRPFPLEIPADARDRVFATVLPLLRARRKHVAIVGAGDAALDYALNLLRRNTVTILNHCTAIQGLPLLWERARASANFHYRDEINVTRVSTSEGSRSLMLQCESKGTASTVSADYVIFALGREAHTSFLSARVREQESILQERGKLYFVGDVRNGPLRQTAIAAGDGLRAAMQIYNARRAG